MYKAGFGVDGALEHTRLVSFVEAFLFSTGIIDNKICTHSYHAMTIVYDESEHVMLFSCAIAIAEPYV